MNPRRTQQRRVAALLDEIAGRRQRLYVLKAHGARPAGLRTLKAELTAVRDELAHVTNAATTPPPQPSDVGTRDQNRKVIPASRPSVARGSRSRPRRGGSGAALRF
jgi:hypothetical protein